VRFTTLLGLSYDVQRASEVTRSLWSLIAANLPGTGGVIQFVDTNAAGDPRRFYRVMLSP
jgi:hypothetical protein